MAPRPYSDRSVLPVETSGNNFIPGMPVQDFAESPPNVLSESSNSSPIPSGFVATEYLITSTDMSENLETIEETSMLPTYPTAEDIMPYDHSLPDFIRQISNQSNLSNIQTLSLRVISSIISLHRMSEYLPNLKELNLEGSALSSLRDIGCNFKNLQILRVGRCQLESLDGTFGLTSLRELYAQKNLINDVSSCSNLPHIRHIDVSENRIRNISYAGFLSTCNHLKSIVFTGNPATEVPDYRKNVRRLLPQIEILDGIPFNAESCETEEVKKIETDVSLSESSDSGSSEAPNFFHVSPSDSMNNFFEAEEAFDAKKIYDVQEKGTEVQPRLQKWDKDIENKSKKSNLWPKVDVRETHCRHQTEEENHIVSSSSDWNQNLKEQTCWDSNEELKGEKEEAESEKPKTFSSFSSIPCSSHSVASENKCEAIKKFTFFQSTNSKIEDESICKSESALGKLTTGLPVCGNLAAALRNRKKNGGENGSSNEKKLETESKTKLNKEKGETYEESEDMYLSVADTSGTANIGLKPKTGLMKKLR